MFVSAEFAAGFTGGIEGPCCNADGVLYAVNYGREGTIGRVLPDGTADVFVELPEGSVGNGIVLDADGTLLVADYTAHRVLRLGVDDRSVTVVAAEPRMHQPNDIAIGPDRRVYASDPDWAHDCASSGGSTRTARPRCSRPAWARPTGSRCRPTAGGCT
ncbi:MAG TPA: hypothetical protein VF053_14985 [Streptosporangiales bacterium]